MSWPLRLLDPPPTAAELDALRPGDCWYAQRGPDGEWRLLEAGEGWRISPPISSQARAGERPPLVVAFPSPPGHIWPCHPWCIDSVASNGGGGWQITGTSPETLTLHPSIAISGRYHGWIRSGVLTDDCEGRTYPHLEAP